MPEHITATEGDSFYFIAIETEDSKYCKIQSQIKYASPEAAANDLRETAELCKNRKVYLLRSVKCLIHEEVIVAKREYDIS